MHDAPGRPSVAPARFWRQLRGSLRRRRKLRKIRSGVRRLGVPVIAITGTNGKTTLALLLERILRTAGYRVGLACTDGVMRDGRWVSGGDQAWARGLWRAARRGGVDALVAETARGGILRYGIGFESCQVAVVTNLSEDHLGLDGVHSLDQMARVKAGVVERVASGGAAVLNADDPRVAAMARLAPGAVIRFSMRERPPSSGPCFFVRDGWIRRGEAGSETPQVAAEAVAMLQGGLLTYNLAHAMAALGALEGVRETLPVSAEVVREVLRRFGTQAEDKPYNFNLVEFRGDHLLLCNSKNPAGFRADLTPLRKLRAAQGYQTVIGLITHVGDRSAAFHRSIAALASEVCDRLMACAPRDPCLRGHSAESIVASLEAGIPVEKRLACGGTDWREVLPRLRRAHPEKTLYVLFDPREHPGVDEVLREGRPLPLMPGER